MWEEKFPVLTSEGSPPLSGLEDMDREEFDELSLFFVRNARRRILFLCPPLLLWTSHKKEEEARTKSLLRGDYTAKAASRVRKITKAAS